MTISQVEHMLNKAENTARRARAMQGKPGRSGAIVDNPDMVAKHERIAADWRRILAFAVSDGAREAIGS